MRKTLGLSGKSLQPNVDRWKDEVFKEKINALIVTRGGELVTFFGLVWVFFFFFLCLALGGRLKSVMDTLKSQDYQVKHTAQCGEAQPQSEVMGPQKHPDESTKRENPEWHRIKP